MQRLETFLILREVILLLASIDGILFRTKNVDHVTGIKVVLRPRADDIGI